MTKNQKSILANTLKTKKEVITIPIKDLTIGEYDKFKKSINSLYRLDKKLMFLKIVYWNYNDLKQTEISYNENIKYNSFHLGDEQLFNVLRYIHNYLSSTNMFIQQYGANVKRENPKLFDEFNEHRKDLYHKNLSYVHMPSPLNHHRFFIITYFLFKHITTFSVILKKTFTQYFQGFVMFFCLSHIRILYLVNF